MMLQNCVETHRGYCVDQCIGNQILSHVFHNVKLSCFYLGNVFVCYCFQLKNHIIFVSNYSKNTKSNLISSAHCFKQSSINSLKAPLMTCILTKIIFNVKKNLNSQSKTYTSATIWQCFY